jgi:hypothetical protein
MHWTSLHRELRRHEQNRGSLAAIVHGHNGCRLTCSQTQQRRVAQTRQYNRLKDETFCSARNGFLHPSAFSIPAPKLSTRAS